MSSQKEFYFHSGARTVFRIGGGFFLGMGLLFIMVRLTESDPFKDPDTWLLLTMGAAFVAVGLWIILFAQRAKITIGEHSAKISTFFGRKTVNYTDIIGLGIYVPPIPYRGFKAYMIRKRTGGAPINFVIRDGGKLIKSFMASSFENYTEILDEFQRRSKQEIVKLNEQSFQEWASGKVSQQI
ncbi:MAG: hypothetical protein AB8G95_08450 [Anaerolineae bacterium]